MTRIAFINPVGTLGGGERSLLDVFRALQLVAPDLERKLITLEPGPLTSRARALGVDVLEHPLPDAFRALGDAESFASALRVVAHAAHGRELLAFCRGFRRAIAGLRPDVLHTNGMKAHLLAGALARQVPSVLHVRDFVSDRRWSRRLLRLARRRALVLVANSRAVARDLERELPGAPVRAVYNSIDFDQFFPGLGDRERLSRLSGMEPPAPGCLCFGMVGTYARWKGHTLFLEAAARLLGRRLPQPVRFYVVGGPIYSTERSQYSREELQSKAAQLGLTRHVGFVPFQEDTAPVYRALDVLVHPSTRPEPFGRTIVEGMACRLPVIVARNGGAVELFDEGTTALGFEPGSAPDLAERMATLAESPTRRNDLGEAAREHVAKRFDLPRLGWELAAVYEELLAGSR